MGQRMLTLAFLQPSPDDHWMNRLTGYVSSHPFCHAELYFESIHQCFSIMWGETACFRTKNLSNPNYTLVSLGVSVKEYDSCLEYCRSVGGQNIGFDDRGMWSSWFPSCLCCSSCEPASQHKGVTFCSKVITEALQFAGVKEVEHLTPAASTPSRLFECVRVSPRIACNSVPFKRQALMLFSTIS